jgi:hypothetical protein
MLSNFSACAMPSPHSFSSPFLEGYPPSSVLFACFVLNWRRIRLDHYHIPTVHCGCHARTRLKMLTTLFGLSCQKKTLPSQRRGIKAFLGL